MGETTRGKNRIRGRQMVCVLGEGIRDPGKLMFPYLQECFHLTTSCLTPDSTREKPGVIRLGTPVPRTRPLGVETAWSAGKPRQCGACSRLPGLQPGSGTQVKGELPFLPAGAAKGRPAVGTVPRGGASRALGPALAALGAGRGRGNPGARRSASSFRGSAVTCTARAAPGAGRSRKPSERGTAEGERGQHPARGSERRRRRRCGGCRAPRRRTGGSCTRLALPRRPGAHPGPHRAAAGAHGSVRGRRPEEREAPGRGRRAAWTAPPPRPALTRGPQPAGATFPPHHRDHGASAAARAERNRPEPLSRGAPVAAGSCMGERGPRSRRCPGRSCPCRRAGRRRATSTARSTT